MNAGKRIENRSEKENYDLKTISLRGRKINSLINDEKHLKLNAAKR